VADERFPTPRDALAHYGVKGMRWGVRKDERGGDREAGSGPALSEKKQKKVDDFFDEAAKARALAKEMDEQGIDHPEMRRLYGKAVDRSDRMFAITYMQSKDTAVRQQIEFNEARAQYLEKNAEAIQQGRLTSNQKKALLGGLAAAAVVGYVGYQIHIDNVSAKAEAGDTIPFSGFRRKYMESADVYMSKPIKSLDSLNDDDIHVPAGTVFSRLTAYKDEDMDGRLYTTFTDADNNKYRGIYGPSLRARTGSKELYISNMTTGEAVRSPSHRKRVEAYIELIREVRPGLEPHQVESYALAKYNSFARSLVTKSSVSDRYFEIIQQKGYNALLDDNDAGQLSDLPMILLQPKKTVANRTFEPLTSEIEKAARKDFTEIQRYEKGLVVPEQFRADRARIRHMVKESLQGAILIPRQPFRTPTEALGRHDAKRRR
jgi:hypothetical protein